MSEKRYDNYNRWRSKTVAFRMSPEEADELNVQVALSGLSKQDYLIQCCLKHEIKVVCGRKVYRLAGDEFVAIVQSGQKEVIDSYAMKILDTFKIPYQIAGGEQYLASSIGIAMYPKDGKNSTEVIAAADHAMYKVKKNGKNSRAFYDAGMEKEP